MTKTKKVIIITAGIVLFILMLLTFLFFIIRSNLRGPLRNEYLSANELKFVDSLARKCSCEIFVEKDMAVEQKEEKNGTVFIVHNYNKSKNNFCLSDSLMLLKDSKQIAATYAGMLSKKDSYDKIAIQYYSSDFGDRSETPTCDRTFYFDAKTIDYLEYSEGNRDIRIKKQND